MAGGRGTSRQGRNPYGEVMRLTNRAERSWRAFRLLLWRRPAAALEDFLAEPLRLVTGQNSGLGSAALVCLPAHLDFA